MLPRMMGERATNARARVRLAAEVRRGLGAMGYEEVETPCLVPPPGMEPHLAPFEAPKPAESEDRK